MLQFAWSPIDHILASCTLSPARPTVLRIHDVKASSPDSSLHRRIPASLTLPAALSQVDPVLLRKMGGPDDGEVRALRQLRRHGVSEDAGGDEGGQAAAEADALKDALTPADVSRMLERMRIQVSLPGPRCRQAQARAPPGAAADGTRPRAAGAGARQAVVRR